MPSAYAHLRFGGDVLSRLPEPAKDAVHKHRKLYDLGTHGPDLFYFYRFWAIHWTDSLGYVYHYGDSKRYFSEIAEILRASASEEATAYLYGLLAHYALDSLCHPYVKKMDEEGQAQHVEIETEFDRFLLETDGMLLPKPHFPMEHLKTRKRERELLRVFYPRATAAQLRESMAMTRFFTGKAMFREGKHTAVVKKLLGSYFSQYLLSPAPNLRCAQTNQELLRLYGEAAERFGCLAEQMQTHLTHGTPLGEEFAPIFG